MISRMGVPRARAEVVRSSMTPRPEAQDGRIDTPVPGDYQGRVTAHRYQLLWRGVRGLAADVGCAHRALVAECHEDEQGRLEVVLDGRHAVRHGRGGARVEHHEVGFVADAERADLGLEA